MRLSHIFTSNTLQINTECQIEPRASHYIARVLRLVEGDQVVLFNGLGGEYLADITAVKGQVVSVRVIEFRDVSVESPLHIHLAQGISRGEKMDYVIQKSVELGVAEITPLFTERCGVKLSGERLEKRLNHWRALVISACEQCGRNTIPVVHDAVHLADWVTTCTVSTKLICHPEVQSEAAEIAGDSDIALLVGPEGGFSGDEVKLALDQQFRGISLGPRILRTETAALAALASLQAQYGDMAKYSAT